MYKKCQKQRKLLSGKDLEKLFQKYDFAFEPFNYENGSLLYFYGRLFKLVVKRTEKIRHECVSLAYHVNSQKNNKLMKKTILILLSLLLGSVALIAQDLSYARKIVDTLTSQEFAGRGYVEKGHLKAANYIRGQYAALGLNSFSDDYFQPFKVKVNTFPASMELSFDDKELIPGEDFHVDAASSSAKGTFEVIKVKKEKLLKDPVFQAIIDYASGKILLIDERDFATASEEASEDIRQRMNYLKYNSEISIAGTILLTHNKLTWHQSVQQGPRVSFVVKGDYDINKLKKVRINVDAKLKELETQNVIGYVEGTEKPDSFLVATAHYDHLGKMGESVYFPGANDNASGVAMLLNLAKYFKNNPPAYSFVFIALGAEELGIVGARHFVENPVINLDGIKFLINFDLAGTGVEGIKVVNGKVYRDKFDRLLQYNATNNYLKAVKIRGEACISDHCPFYRQEVPSFYIYTLGGIKAYHDIYDKAETLPLTEFVDYYRLMVDFYKSF